MTSTARPRAEDAGAAADERLAGLEADRWRTFEDAQREADTLFAQYQLSQLLASGADVAHLASAVLDELRRHDRARAAVLWLTPPGGGPLSLVSMVGDGAGSSAPPPSPPERFPDGAAAAGWCRAFGYWGVALEESRDGGDGFERETVGFVALAPAGPRRGGERPAFLPRVRHELAMAFRGAQLREALAHERSLLSAILDGATDAIVAVDSERRVVRLNPAALALLDVTPESVPAACRHLLGCARLHVGTASHRLRCGPRCPFADVLSGGPPITGREQTVIGPHDEEIPVAASYAPMAGGGAVAVLHDLRASRALDQLRSTFVAAVSHDLRTPLALISAYVDTLLGLDLDPAGRRRAIEGIGHAAHRLDNLVNEILDVARLESDRIALHRSRASLAAIIGRVVSGLGDAPGIPAIDVAPAPDLPAVTVDPDRIAQVLDNLVMNAAKYGPVGGRISIRASVRDRMVVVSVHDEGAGIDEADRDQVFERFYRGRQARSGTPGTGLGLYVCRRLVEAHGGEIWVDDSTSGASISFTIPIAAPARLRHSAPAADSTGTGA
ncbi:MAG: ATP-binding protein [Chloroflexi bacterium]|nr:ATP-binding protein [Chloroflexota bacterium]